MDKTGPLECAAPCKTILQPDTIPLWAWIGYFVLVSACFLLFQQPDLYHASTSSYAYLHGHIADFYDYN